MRFMPNLRNCRLSASLAIVLAANPSARGGADFFSAGVRPTDPLTPAEQLEKFRLPEGFRIELVAAEPDIAKPMNLAFDVRGRLWVTDSVEYPYAAPLDRPGRDAVRIIEDIDRDGRYDRVKTFADGLNIPIGLYPWKHGVVVWSIPHIWFIEDRDGDGRADRKTRLYGPLGYERDTHGMNSSFTRGFDGWLYVTHGFNNQSTIRGADGSELTLHSGNVWRGRLDGSRVEPFAFGQVNPFGMALDPLGDFYTSDCHSKPAWLLLRDAYYPSFGKPHDGLGFGPELMRHAHGSTALDGVVHYSGRLWPLEYRDNLLIGNVMTSRVNRDVLVEKGAGREAIEAPDFVSCDDPWFRPVNMQFGPDGALYIADFYNRIIGHYEVPLDHPERDRHRGRIWKISYTGVLGRPVVRHPPFDLTRLSIPEIFGELTSSELIRRRLAADYLVDEIGEAALPQARKLTHRETPSSDWRQLVHSLWIRHRLEDLDQETLERAASDPRREVRVHAMRILSETFPWNELRRRLALTGLQDLQPLVRRAATDALGRHPDAGHIAPLIAARQKTDDRDPFLKHSLRLALRNQLRETAHFEAVDRQTWTPEQSATIADIAVAVRSPVAARFLLRHISRHRSSPKQIAAYAEHIANYALPSDQDPTDRERLLTIVDRLLGTNPEALLNIYETLEAAEKKQTGGVSPNTRDWGERLAVKLLDQAAASSSDWFHRPVPGRTTGNVPWVLQERSSADSERNSRFISSLSSGGESYTGILRSRSFPLPERLSFFLAGHDGYPETELKGHNFVRLILEKDRRTVASAAPPRNDTAQPVEWNLSAYHDQLGYLEIVDGNNEGAYAWLALGRLSPAVVSLPRSSPQRQGRYLVAAARIAAGNQPELDSRLANTAIAADIPPLVRARITQAICRARNDPIGASLAGLIADSSLNENRRQDLGRRLLLDNALAHRELIEELWPLLPNRGQERLLNDLVVNQKGAELALTLAEEGVISQFPVPVREQIGRHGGLLVQRLDSLDLPASPAADSFESLRQRERLFARILRREGNPEAGRQLFDQACRICHQIGDHGSLVGPQLDGIANRGPERLLEDILDPNRNVDPAFRTETLTLDNGDVLTVLFRSRSDDQTVFANAAGQEFALSNASILERRSANRSLMPDNYLQVLTEPQIVDLASFLLATGNSSPRKP